MIKIKTLTLSRSRSLVIVFALIASLLSLVTQPASAAPPADYDGTNGKVNCGTSGYFVISGNVVYGRYNCRGSVVIPEGVTVVAGEAFDAAFEYGGGIGRENPYDSTISTQITSLTLPSTLTTIGSFAFRDNQITSLSIPNSVTSIGIFAFAGNSLVTSLTIGSGLATISSATFAGLNSLSSLTIPDTVSLIEGDAFAGTSSLATLNYCGIADLAGTGLPNPSTNASSCVLGAPSNLVATPGNGSASIAFTAGTGRSSITNYQYSLDGTNYSALSPADTYSPVTIPGLTAGTSYTIRLKAVNAGGVSAASTSVSASVLYDGTNGAVMCGTSGYFTISNNVVTGNTSCVGSVTIPSGVTRVGNDAFYHLGSAISALTIPSTVTTIGSRAFGEIWNIQSITIPDSVTTIGSEAFSYVYSLNTLTLGSGLTSIGDSAFVGARYLQSIVIPNSVTSIGPRAFSFTLTSALTSLTIGTNVREIGLEAFSGATSLQSVTIPDGVTSIGANAFRNVASPFTLNYCGTANLSGTGLPNPSSNASSCAPVAPAFSISSSSETATVNSVITGYTITSTGGTIASYSISPDISNTPGLSFNTSTGLISGTPTTVASSRTYTITGTNATSPSATRTFTITVNPIAPAFSISSSSETVTAGTAITGYTITSTGGAIASYSISPAISSTPGLSFSTSTGLISGTPTTAASSQTYTITATNATSPSATRTFAITVNAPPTPAASISTTTFAPGVASNIGATLSNFDQTKSYQVTVKFVNAATNVDVVNGTLVATQGSTSLISGYTSFSGAKLGFKGTYAAISSALASITWNPAVASGGISIRIGISTSPGTNEFYDANSAHYYRYVSSGLSAIAARTAAENTTLFGLRGYLVEINSEAENNFVGKETTATNIWIGASDRLVEGTFVWDGASNTYARPTGSGAAAIGAGVFSSWAGGEPNDYPWDPLAAPEREDCVLTNWQGSVGKWNDYPCRQVLGYLIEYGGRPGETSTAVAATLTTTVTAVNPPTFTAIYDKNGAVGTLAKASDTYTQGRTAITLPGAGTMTKTGYTFAGWSESGTAPVISGTYAPTSSVTLKAVWTAVNYTITYNANGGNTTPTQASKTIGESFILANAITKPDSGSISYQFIGWNDGSSTYNAGKTITVGSANLTYTAVWVVQFEVTYASNGGVFAAGDTAKDSQCIGVGNLCTNNQSITLNSAPTRAGYTFAGWEDQGANLISGSDSGSGAVQTTVTTSRYIFSARWTAVNYTVSYVSSGSTASTETSKNIGQRFAIGAAVTKANFDFAGWSDGSNTYWPNAIYIVGSTNITLTALWTSRYTITYSEGLGTGNPPTDTDTYRPGDVHEVLSGIGIERDEYIFNGWSDGTATYQPAALYSVGSGNVTLTAQWVPVYTVSYAQDLGPSAGVPPTDSLSYQTGQSATLLSGSSLTNPGFTFAGWSDGTRTYQTGGTYTVATSNITLTAQWIANPVSSTPAVAPTPEVWSTYFDDNGADSGYSPDGIGVSQKSNASISLPGNIGSFANSNKKQAMKKDGFEFIGWSTSKSGTTPLPASFTPTSNSTLYAIWKAVQAPTPTPSPTPKPTVTPTPTPTATPKPTPTPTPSPTSISNFQPSQQMEKVGTVYMASGTYFLNDATKITLKALALKINASGAKTILVYGHADSRGGVDNTLLSRNRAKAVANFLRPLLTSKKISIGWYSSNKPAVAGTSAAALAQNRRVEIYTK